MTPGSSDREGSDADSSVGYIDSALLRNTVRLRLDGADSDNRPTRAEFFYPKTGVNGRGPIDNDASINQKEVNLYLEYAPAGQLFSVFIEEPYRYIHGDQQGLGDLNAGVKLALARSNDFNATFQFRTWAPTGDGRQGLGTEHVSLEPSLLTNWRLLEVLTVESELRYWAPVGGTDFAGDVVRYGVGISYRDPCAEGIWISPVAEFVGWTVLGGKEITDVAGDMKNAAGDTIVNAKAGVRFGSANQWDAYVGYGRALTGAVWYKDDVRLEFRFFY
jgi:hypothetical protein